MKKNTKLFIGITAPQSVDLLNGQLKHFRKKGYDVYLLAPKTDQVVDFCKQEDVKLLSISIKRNPHPLYDIYTLLQLIWVFFKEKPDIVNLGTPKMSLLGLVAARVIGVPYRIYTCHGFRFEHEKGFFGKFLMWIEKVTASCAHKIICVSPSVKDLGVRAGIFSREKAIHIGKGSNNGIDLTLFDPRCIKERDRQEMRDYYGLNGYFVFGFVGRLVDRKGITELYAAFDRFYRENSNIKLLMVGRPYWDQIRDKDIIEKYHNHPGIIMAGLQPPDTIPLFLSVFDAFVLPAWWEGFGNVLIQAAAMGVPIISTQATGCKDAVSDGFNGMLVEPHSPEKFEKAMRFFYDHRDKIEEYGRNGRIWAKNFQPEIIWKGIEKAYQL